MEDKLLTTGKKLLALLMVLCLIHCGLPCAYAEETAKGEVKLNTRLDYSQLELQVAVANGLIGYDYTKETWDPVAKTLETAHQIMEAEEDYDQSDIDDTAKALEKKIAALVKMDYAQLEAALEAVDSKIGENPQLHDTWARLDDDAQQARMLLLSGDQAAVDQAATRINWLMEELEQQLAEQEPEVVVREVEVEVLPQSDYCNIPMHRTWPVLFTISAVLNVALIAMLTYIIMHKRKTEDNTPLVNYDIDDDLDL